jgi:hypothetical protein
MKRSTMEAYMIRFLESLELTSEAKEGIISLVFGDLVPTDALRIEAYYDKCSEVELMLIIINAIKSRIKFLMEL